MRPIPKRLRKEVLQEYEAASTDPKGYLQSFQSKDRPSAAQLVALHRVFTEYDVELSDNRPMSLMRRDGTSVQTNNINLISTDVTQHDVKPDRNLLKNLDDLITPIHTIKANNENWRSYIQYQIHQLEDYTPDAVTKDDMFIHKLAVVNGRRCCTST